MKKQAIKFVSSSQLKAFNTCAFAYHKIFVEFREKLKLKNNQYFNVFSEDYHELGTFIHRVAELYMTTSKPIAILCTQVLKECPISLEKYVEAKQILSVLDKRDYKKHKVLGTEKEFEVILKNGIALRGKIDLILELDKDTIEIVDYKSGNRPFFKDAIKYDIQFQVYYLAVKQMFPNYKNIILTVDALRFEPISLDTAELNEEGILEYLESLYGKITETKEFQTKLNRFCGFCQVYHLCPLMKQHGKLGIKMVIKDDPKLLQKYAQDYLDISATVAGMQNKIEDYKNFFRCLSEKEGKEIMEYPWGKISVNNNRISVSCKKSS